MFLSPELAGEAALLICAVANGQPRKITPRPSAADKNLGSIAMLACHPEYVDIDPGFRSIFDGLLSINRRPSERVARMKEAC
jgi:hypothetical protein